jgi:anaerobic selenocysteine-containing dehydrogenase
MRGLRLVTFSPFLTNTAAAGDWLPLRTHAAATLAAMAIARQALSDPSLQMPFPFSDMAGLLQSLAPSYIEKASGLSHETIQELSRRFFNEPGPAVSDIPDISVLLLNIMKGNLDRPGGLFNPGQSILGVDAVPGDLVELLRDRRNIVFLHQSNPAFSRSSEIRTILRSSDRAVVVCIDSFMSETAELSDFVLPLASPLETLTVAEPLPLAKPFVAVAPPATKPPASCRAFDDWLALFATIVNGSAPALSPERFAAEVVSGKSSGKLAGDRAIYTMSSGRKPLKAHVPSMVSSLKTLMALVPKLPVHLPLRPEQYFLTVFEESVQSPLAVAAKWLNEISYSPKVYLHPQRAGRLGIRSGDRITLTSSDGISYEGVALLFEGVHPDALAIAMHHGHTAYGRVARGEQFSDSKDSDMSRMFWGKIRGINPADIYGSIVAIKKNRG